MRIAFTGSSSTGKTTLAKLLSDDPVVRSVSSLCLLSSNYVSCLDFGYSSADKMPSTIRRRWRQAYFHQKRLAEEQHDGFITDRSAIDIAAYWILFDNEAEDVREDAFVESCRKMASEYDMHFYFPYGIIPVETSPRRSNKEDLHLAVDELIIQLLDKWKLPFVSIVGNDLDNRCDQVRRWISNQESNQTSK